jgi:hypothetical protein
LTSIVTTAASLGSSKFDCDLQSNASCQAKNTDTNGDSCHNKDTNSAENETSCENENADSAENQNTDSDRDSIITTNDLQESHRDSAGLVCAK